jgi:hypothetical protein
VTVSSQAKIDAAVTMNSTEAVVSIGVEGGLGQRLQIVIVR